MRDKGTTKDRALDSEQKGGKEHRGNHHSPCGCDCKGWAGVVMSSRQGEGWEIVVIGMTGTINDNGSLDG
jgi:hypothetical protein